MIHKNSNSNNDNNNNYNPNRSMAEKTDNRGPEIDRRRSGRARAADALLRKAAPVRMAVRMRLCACVRARARVMCVYLRESAVCGNVGMVERRETRWVCGERRTRGTVVPSLIRSRLPPPSLPHSSRCHAALLRAGGLRMRQPGPRRAIGCTEIRL